MRILEARASGNAGLIRWLAGHLSALAELAVPTDLPPCPAHTMRNRDARLGWDIPGRTQAQIEADASAVGKPVATVLEWCAGKGHLGRLLTQSWRMPVTGLEIEPRRCRAGEALVRPTHVEER